MKQTLSLVVYHSEVSMEIVSVKFYFEQMKNVLYSHSLKYGLQILMKAPFTVSQKWPLSLSLLILKYLPFRIIYS